MVGRDLDNFYVRDYCDVEHAPIALEVKNLSHQEHSKISAFRFIKARYLDLQGW